MAPDRSSWTTAAAHPGPKALVVAHDTKRVMLSQQWWSPDGQCLRLGLVWEVAEVNRPAVRGTLSKGSVTAVRAEGLPLPPAFLIRRELPPAQPEPQPGQLEIPTERPAREPYEPITRTDCFRPAAGPTVVAPRRTLSRLLPDSHYLAYKKYEAEILANAELNRRLYEQAERAERKAAAKAGEQRALRKTRNQAEPEFKPEQPGLF